MQYRPLGQSGISASVIGLGCWAIGGWMWGGNEEQDSIRAIQTSIDEGINLIDTAAVYGQGYSEEVVGKAIVGRRGDVVLATKCGLRWDTGKGVKHFERGGLSFHKYLAAESIKQEVELSLQRLKVDVIDLYQTHWQDESTPIEETMTALLELKQEGKIRAIGVSNATVGHMKEYRAVGPLDSGQEKYSMIDRKLDGEYLPFCNENNIAVLAYSPMAMGLLTGKVGPERQFEGDDIRKDIPRFSVENRKKMMSLLDDIKPVADKHGITLAQLAVAWSIHQPGLTHALVGARNDIQAKENAKSGDVKLDDGDLQAIETALQAHGKDIV